MKQTQRSSRFKSSWISLLVIVVLFMTSMTFAADARWIKVTRLHNFYQAIGSEPEEDFGNEQQFGMRWNAFYDHQDMQAAKAVWIGTTNYDDPLAGTTFNYKVAFCGPRPRPEIAENEFMPVDFGMTGKFAAPTVIVDGELASDLDWDDLVDQGGFDIFQGADRVIHNTVNTSVGITMERKIYAFSQQYYDNMMIHEYTFVNTGVVSKDPSITHDGTLTDVYFHWQYRNSIAGEGTVEGSVIDWRGRRGWGTPQNCRWGMNTMNAVIGEDPDNPVTPSLFADEGGSMGVDEPPGMTALSARSSIVPPHRSARKVASGVPSSWAAPEANSPMRTMCSSSAVRWRSSARCSERAIPSDILLGLPIGIYVFGQFFGHDIFG
jgi:hypothetical protein